ncbi:MAG TPA: hypothetical protein VGE85_11440 [Terracidiphilus sp.]|jgi:hypothetical protein
MADINIRGVPLQIRDRIRLRARAEGCRCPRDWIVKVLTAALRVPLHPRNPAQDEAAQDEDESQEKTA